ncbi:unnamed protein product [Dracunculus medinensis]|uniref:Tetraspanin n=1 Tax=Dracunculus medinensis TaxID=318479 RepID=A0A0N4U845_DRAME|nr:unnamed protein product [Dracunculus medinensis]
MPNDCLSKTCKYVFLALNAILCIFGAVICALSLWMRFDITIRQKFVNILSQWDPINYDIAEYDIALYVIAGIAFILFIFALFGYFGAFCEKLCAIRVYFSLILLLLLLEIAGLIYLLIDQEQVKNLFIKIFKEELVDRFYKNSLIRQELDELQSQAHCCGASGCEDYLFAPLSCGCSPHVRVTGCAIKLLNAVSENMPVILSIAGIIIIIQFLALIFSCITCVAIKRKQHN